jgi:hypothetical protein
MVSEPKAYPLGRRQPKRAEAVLMSPITITITAGAPKDRAFVAVDGRTFEARSSAGAGFALCRKLVAASIPDRPYEVINTAAPGVVSMRGPSIYAAAGLTVEQRDGQAPRFARFTPRDENAPQSIGVRPYTRAGAEWCSARS